MKARSFSHVGITVSDFNKAVRFYWDVFGCPLVGVADTPPERVRSFFGVEGRRGSGRRSRPARSAGSVCRAEQSWRFSSSSRSCRRPPIPWNKVGLTHISFNVRNLSALARLSGEQGRRVHQQAGALAARSLVLLCEGLRRQPDRADGPRPHVLRPRLARSARRLDLPARDVQEVLRTYGWSRSSDVA